jgi:hypothetical protein
MYRKLSPFAFFLVFAFVGCINDTEPEDTIMIPVAPSGSIYAVVNGDEEVHSEEYYVGYRQFKYTSFNIYVKFTNGYYLTLKFGDINVDDINMQQRSSYQGYLWDSKRMYTTYSKTGEDIATMTITSWDTIAKTISGTFSYNINYGQRYGQYRVSQGTFTDIPYSDQIKSTENTIFTIEGSSLVDTSNMLYTNNFLWRPSNKLEINLTRLDSGFSNHAQIRILVPERKIFMGTHDLRTSAYDISCVVANKDTSYFYPIDSLQSGTITIFSYDKINRKISGSFDFFTKDNVGDPPVRVIGSFNENGWDDFITN